MRTQVSLVVALLALLACARATAPDSPWEPEAAFPDSEEEMDDGMEVVAHQRKEVVANAPNTKTPTSTSPTATGGKTATQTSSSVTSSPTTTTKKAVSKTATDKAAAATSTATVSGEKSTTTTAPATTKVPDSAPVPETSAADDNLAAPPKAEAAKAEKPKEPVAPLATKDDETPKPEAESAAPSGASKATVKAVEVEPVKNAYCDVVSASSVCLASGSKVMSPDAHPDGLVGHWSFDDMHGLDHSGHMNHAERPHRVGPGLGGRGASAAFDGKTVHTVAHSSKFNAKAFTVTFWVYLLEDPAGHWRTLVHKGAGELERGPSILLEKESRRLKFAVSTEGGAKFGEPVVSMAPIPLRRWVHVAALREPGFMKLFINGILDNELKTNATMKFNNGPLFIGGDPFHQFGSVSYIDEVRFYARALSTDEIQAESGFALGGIDANFIHLACASCTNEDAIKKCRNHYHLCTHGELYSGGYQVARIMGWSDLHQHVWSGTEARSMQNNRALSFQSMLEVDLEAETEKGKGEKQVALAMCCRD